MVTQQGIVFPSAQPGYLNMQDFDRSGAFHQTGQPVSCWNTRRRSCAASCGRWRGDQTRAALHIADYVDLTARGKPSSYLAELGQAILLAGDAAHIHAPLARPDRLNLGLGDDQRILAAKLAMPPSTSKRRKACSDSYCTERSSAQARRCLDWSRAQVAVMRPSAEGRSAERIFLAVDLLNTRRWRRPAIGIAQHACGASHVRK